ncbi:Serine/threonine protein kinase PrkC, regulator of stationary phase [Alkalibacterium sp. AK22]|uniref:Stk1 family PASTA domain-containing Ser/Thr kinase n=1 Tax=Alkalibacterium sp. AK22 TaxID=1229520 RepID=UPI0004531E96|nr:Stk1 family PASTA domain-containing Ser/Thr kinase [Alkalibacterium sp. AK22]EXJ24226.1 Serine/threonine protein kinase PrkC, regulator of stationary phase [Alkalibacterium sp. AK22]
MIPGERISNRYKIIKEIGSGGMAKVYLATDLILERQVAVKLMAYNFHNDEASIRRFKREALSTTELTHPNIVNVVDVGEDDTPYIVMEYVEGYDLKDFIKHHHPLPYRKTIGIMTQILDAVEYAHNHNIIHRDLKPQNILIDHDEKVKITDFGIAVALSENSITQTNSLLGSVHYISPEQARGSMATKQSDIYSLGILLYEMLSGKVPFDGESAVSIALKHFQNDMPSLKENDSSLPQALENVVLRATAKEASNRYGSIVEMKEDLESALSASRSDEARFEPTSFSDDETKMIQPIPVPAQAEFTAKTDNSRTATLELANASDKASPQDEQSSWKKRRNLLLIIILLLVMIGSLLVFSMTRPQEVQVPDFSGVSLEEVENSLSELNLELGELTEQYHAEIEADHVIRSRPSEGAVLREGAAINLYVSMGEERVAMENYEGQAFEDARAELTDLGFTVEREEAFSAEVQEGRVISQSLEAGEEAVPGDTIVTLVVSTGPEGFALRRLIGYSSVGVEDYANDLNLSVTITNEPHDTIPEGQVARQSPEPGTTIYPGSRISVVFSSGPEEPETISFDRGIIVDYESPNNRDDENETEESEENDENDEQDVEEQSLEANQIEIYVEDAENSFDEVYRAFDIFEDTPVILNLTVEEGQTAAFRVYRDGELIKEELEISPDD